MEKPVLVVLAAGMGSRYGGMNQLDPGNPFDCLVLYALAADCCGEFLSDNFSRALEVLFSGAQGGG